MPYLLTYGPKRVLKLMPLRNLREPLNRRKWGWGNSRHYGVRLSEEGLNLAAWTGIHAIPEAAPNFVYATAGRLSRNRSSTARLSVSC